MPTPLPSPRRPPTSRTVNTIAVLGLVPIIVYVFVAGRLNISGGWYILGLLLGMLCWPLSLITAAWWLTPRNRIPPPPTAPEPTVASLAPGPQPVRRSTPRPRPSGSPYPHRPYPGAPFDLGGD